MELLTLLIVVICLLLLLVVPVALGAFLIGKAIVTLVIKAVEGVSGCLQIVFDLLGSSQTKLDDEETLKDVSKL